MANQRAEEHPPIRIGPWRATGALVRHAFGPELLFAEPDWDRPVLKNSPDDTAHGGRREEIREAIAPAGGEAVMKLVGWLDEKVKKSKVVKTNRELQFAHSQRIDHAVGPPHHLVTTLAVKDLVGDQHDQPSPDDFADRVRRLSREQREWFNGRRGGFVMVKYAPMGYTSMPHPSNSPFIDALASRLAGDPSVRAPEMVVSAVDAWLADERYHDDVAKMVPKAVLAHSLLRIAQQVCWAFKEAAHRFPYDRRGTYQDFRHRDVKPENLFVDPRGMVRLGDFGHAKEDEDSSVTSEGTHISAAYASPEDLRYDVSLRELDGRDDVWKLGMTLAALWLKVLRIHSYETLDYPYDHPLADVSLTNESTRAAAVVDHDRHVELLSTMPTALAAVVAAMLATDRDRRPDHELAEQLVEAVLSGGHDANSAVAWDRAAISGAKFAADLGSPEEVTATAVATATANGRATLDEELERAARGHQQFRSLMALRG
jgi:hypothetical protein